MVDYNYWDGLQVIHDMHGKDLVDRLMEIAEAEGAQEFVVGLPTRSVGRHLDRVCRTPFFRV